MSEWEDHEPDQEYEEQRDVLPDCCHCGDEGASRRVYLPGGPQWFHVKCWERFNRLPLRDP